MMTSLQAYCSQRKNWKLLMGFLIVDALLCAIVIAKISYTEIDWKAYMEEVEGFLGGELDYINLRGSTGPLVYPAGFLYIFSLLRYLTSDGRDIIMAQCIFALVYIINLLVVYLVYDKSAAVPAMMGVVLILSKRMHSIYMLRMFNDCIAVLLGHLAIYLYCRHRWRLGCILYSCAVAVKMNMLLYAPGLLLVLLLANGWPETLFCISLCALVQFVLGAPFLLSYPISYVTKAFEFGRVFTYIWTVNYKFLPESLFVSKALSVFLLVCTLLGYALFARRWISEMARSKVQLPWPSLQQPATRYQLSPNFIAGTLWTSNLIGVVFARSLHYQFYCWYFHSLPLLLLQSPLPACISLLLMAGAETSFNIFPSTASSSLLLQGCHVLMLGAVYYSHIPSQPLEDRRDKAK